MADVQETAQHSAARQLAREKAAGFREQQDALEELAADYFVAAQAVSEIRAAAEAEIAAVQEREALAVREATAQADLLICRMLDLGAPRTEVAERLGLANRHIRRAMDTHQRNTRTVKNAKTVTPS